jgi:hypothetical protein
MGAHEISTDCTDYTDYTLYTDDPDRLLVDNIYRPTKSGDPYGLDTNAG